MQGLGFDRACVVCLSLSLSPLTRSRHLWVVIVLMHVWTRVWWRVVGWPLVPIGHSHELIQFFVILVFYSAKMESVTIIRSLHDSKSKLAPNTVTSNFQFSFSVFWCL